MTFYYLFTAHPKTSLFITHGGLFSTQEALHFGVPVIGMPIYVDQLNNIAQAEADGWGFMLKWEELTEEKLKSLITKALDKK